MIHPPTNRIVRADVHGFLASLPGGCADLSILDPGYGFGKGDWDVCPDYDASLFREVRRVLKPTGTAYIFAPPGVAAEFWSSFPNPKRLIFWQVTNRVVPKATSWQPTAEAIVMLTKGRTPYFDRDAVREAYSPSFQRQRGRRRSPSPGRFGSKESIFSYAAGALPRDVLRGPGLSGRVGSRESVGHPCQKPLWLLERLISASCPPGGTVIDLYSGSATCSLAAHRLGRKWIAVEQDEGWSDVALKRLRDAGAEAEIVTPAEPEALGDLLAWRIQATAEIAELRATLAALKRVSS